MIFAYFTLFVALVIEAVGAYYSVTGLAAIFSGALIPILIMGGSLEVGKVTAAVWLKLNWERASIAYKLYLVPAVAFLMVLTSMGIFGFLSKAHSDQSLVTGDSQAKVAIYDEKIKTSKDNIDANRKAIKQMDDAVDQVMGRSNDEKGADKAVAVRRSQQKERSRLLAEIEAEQRKVAALSEERAPYAAEFRKVESEVGPIKYIAALVYGDNPDQNVLERAVRLVIIIIVAVFDPLALVLILAAQQSLRWAREEKEVAQPEEVTVEEEDRSVEITKDTQAEEDQSSEGEPKPEPSIFEQHPYLLKPFAHFENLVPMVAKSENTIMEDVAEAVETPVEQLPLSQEELDELDMALQSGPKPISDFPELQALVKQGLEDGTLSIQGAVEPEEPKILAMGVDVTERPGDYLTPPEQTVDQPDVHYIGDSEHIHYEGKSYSIEAFKAMFPDLAPLADNHPILNQPAKASFGNEFPPKPDKGDMFLRTDFLPSRQYKYNGSKWIEVDKSTDVLAYDEQYIQHLVEKIGSGEYDVEDLSETEQAQIAEYLKKSSERNSE